MPWKCGYWSGGETLPVDKNSDATVTEQWCIWFELFNVFIKLLIVIDHILSFCNALGVCLLTQDLLTKTVIKQMSNSDKTVMQQWSKQWCLWFDLQGFKMTLMKFYPFAMHLKCDYASAGDKRPFDKNSDQTVLRQWWNSDATVCSVTQDLLTKTVIKQKWDSDGTALHSILALRCHFQGFEMSLSIFYYYYYYYYSSRIWTEEVSTSIYSTRAFFWYQRRLDL
jgi:hypothetical protein